MSRLLFTMKCTNWQTLMLKISLMAFILSILLTGACQKSVPVSSSRGNNSFKKDTIVELANYLDSLAQINDSSKSEFFRHFPNNYKLFDKLYGYDDINGPGPLYSKYEEHLNILCNNISISPYNRAYKYIQLGLNGKWDADGIEILQSCTKKFVLENTEIILNILSQDFKKNSGSFWYFILDGPHPNDKELKKYVEILYGLISTKDENQAGILIAEYQKVKENNQE